MKHLSRTGIEYGDLNWSFYPGCKHGVDKCPVSAHCWARAMSKRQGRNHNEPHLIPELLLAPLSVKKPSTILVNFMGDLMGDWVDPEQKVELLEGSALTTHSLRFWVMYAMHKSPQHRFLFLTKNPESYQKWGDFPESSWLGASVCNQEMLYDAMAALRGVNAKHKWLSIEPLLEQLNGGECEGNRLDGLRAAGIEWVVIGGQSQPTVMPERAWVREIVFACDHLRIKVWLKENLRPVFNQGPLSGYIPEWATERGEYRQELPWVPTAAEVMKAKKERP